MSNHIRTMVAALAVALASCLPVAAETVAAVPQAQRIVAVGGSITEIIYALGEEDRLVARDSTSIHPQAALALPDVGYIRALSPENVLALGPDAIVALAGSGPPEAVDVLKKASVPYVEVPDGYDRAGILRKIEMVGDAIGEGAKADALAAKVGAELDAVARITGGLSERKRVLFILSFQDGDRKSVV